MNAQQLQFLVRRLEADNAQLLRSLAYSRIAIEISATLLNSIIFDIARGVPLEELAKEWEQEWK